MRVYISVIAYLGGRAECLAAAESDSGTDQMVSGVKLAGMRGLAGANYGVLGQSQPVGFSSALI